MRRSHFIDKDEDNSEIDLTPMLDVVFIMLIFFIVTASFVKEFGLEMNRPESSDAPPNDDNAAIVVNVRQANDFYIENRRIDVRALRSNIERLHAEKPKAGVVVRVHPKSQAGAFIQVADAAREAGVYNVNLVSSE
jgi:biopolymer transport protein ExbD